MAQTVYCSSEDDQVAAVILTNLENGDTDAFCATCWRDVVVSMAAAFLEGAEAPEAAPEGPDDRTPEQRADDELEADELASMWPDEDAGGRTAGAANGADPEAPGAVEDETAPLSG